MKDAWNEQFHLFRRNLLLVRDKPSKNAVHDLRVAIKHIRAYLRLREFLTGENWKNVFSRIKELFNIAGKQRDFEMSLSLLPRMARKQNLGLDGFYSYLQINKRFARARLKKAANDFDLAVTEEQALDIEKSFGQLDTTANKEKLERRISGLTEKVKSLSGDCKENIHTIRKLLKDTSYYIKITGESFESDPSLTGRLDKIMQLTGKWQDYFIFLHKTRLFRKEYAIRATVEYDHCTVLKAALKENMEKITGETARELKKL